MISPSHEFMEMKKFSSIFNNTPTKGEYDTPSTSTESNDEKDDNKNEEKETILKQTIGKCNDTKESILKQTIIKSGNML